MVPIFLHKVKGDQKLRVRKELGGVRKTRPGYSGKRERELSGGQGGGLVGMLSTQMRVLRSLSAANSTKLCHSPKTTILWAWSLGWPCRIKRTRGKELGA